MNLQKLKNMKIQQKASIAYLAASLLSKSVSFVTLPIFTKIMSTSEIGVSTTFSSWDTILYAVVTLSLCSSSVNVAMMEYKNDRDRYQSTCLTLSTLSALIFAIIYFFHYRIINQVTTLSSPLMITMILYLLFNPALDIWYARQRYEYKYKNVVAVSILSTFASAGISIIAVVSAKYQNIQELGTIRVLSQFSVLILIDIIIYLLLMHRGRTFYDKTMWKFALRLSLPMIIHTLAKSVLDMSDRLMITSMCGKSEAGIYGTVYNISTMSLIVWNAINRSLVPTIFEKLENKDYKSLNKLIDKVLMVYGVMAILMTLVAPEILMILTTSEYFDAVYMMPAISAGIYLTALYDIFVTMLMYKKKSSNVMTATLLAAITNIILNYFCIPKFGYMAAAYTTLFSFVLLSLLQGDMQQRIYKENVIDKKKVYLLTACIIIICMSCVLIYKTTIIRYAIILIILLVIFYNRKEIIKLIKR